MLGAFRRSKTSLVLTMLAHARSGALGRGIWSVCVCFAACIAALRAVGATAARIDSFPSPLRPFHMVSVGLD